MGYENNPFSSPNGGFPTVHIERQSLEGIVANLVGRLSAGRYDLGLAIKGPRGIGKSTELHRIGDLALAQGILPIYAILSGDIEPQDAISAAICAALRYKDKPAAKTTWSAKGRIPFTPMELGVERETTNTNRSLADLVEELARERSPKRTPLLFLIDEGDFLTPNSWDRVLRTCFGEAAQKDLPISFVVTGTTQAFRYSMRGVSSYVGPNHRLVYLPRMRLDEGVLLLTQTAQIGSQEWNPNDLRGVFDACRGVTRELQIAGRDIFDDEGTLPVRANRAAANVTARMESYYRTLPDHEAVIYQALRRNPSSGRLGVLELVPQLILAGEGVLWPKEGKGVGFRRWAMRGDRSSSRAQRVPAMSDVRWQEVRQIVSRLEEFGMIDIDDQGKCHW